MTRKITLLALTLTFAVGAAVGAFALGGSDAQTQVRNAAAEDVSGPCDEAEHANDPRCAGNGGNQPADDDEPGEDRHGGNGRDHPEDDGTVDDDGDDAGEDISGPCDEAEHANDPECTGVTPGAGDDGDDDVGEDVGDDHGDDVDDDEVDNSGPGSANSGPGSVNSGSSDDSGSDDDNSGSGSSGEDNSGSGSSSSGSGSSGSGSSGSGGGDDD